MNFDVRGFFFGRAGSSGYIVGMDFFDWQECHLFYKNNYLYFFKLPQLERSFI